MNKTTLFCALAVSVVVSGCAGTYKAPVTSPVVVSRQVNLSQEAVIKAAKAVLTADSYQIANYDEKSGLVSTTPKNQPLSPLQADCGKTLGLDYLRDKRTKTRISFDVIYVNGLVTVRANIEGEYKTGDSFQDIILTCVSRGGLENGLLNDILAKANQPSKIE